MTLTKKDLEAIRDEVVAATEPLADRVTSVEQSLQLSCGEGPLEPVQQELREPAAEMRDNFRDFFEDVRLVKELRERVAKLEKRRT